GVETARRQNGSAALAVPTAEYQDEQDEELYKASPLLPPTAVATLPPRSELPPRVVSIGGGLKSRFTEVLESAVALTLPRQPDAEHDDHATHAPASQPNNPQKSDVAVAIGRTKQSTAPAEDPAISATQLLARK